MFANARCRWLLTLGVPATATAQPKADAALAELGPLTRDDSLRCVAEKSGSVVLELEGSWSGYLRAAKAVLNRHVSTVCLCPVQRIEPVFTASYLALYESGEPTILDNFVQIQGPLFLRAVKHARGKYPTRWNLPPAEEILPAVWERCISRLPQIIREYSPEKGAQSAYLYAIAKNAAHDVIRPLLNDPAEPMEPERIPQPASRHRLHEILESRELVEKLMAAFERDCAQRRKQKEPSDWELFHAYFLEETPKEEICGRYHLNSNTFDIRLHRIRERCKEILKSWLRSEESACSAPHV